MNRLLAGADELVRQTGAAVLLVHHSGNAGDRPRGSSSMRGGVTMYARLAAAAGKHRNKAGTTVSLTADKLSGAVEFPKLTRTFQEVSLPDGATSLVLVDRDTAPHQQRSFDQALGAFNALPQPVTGAALGKALGVSRQRGDQWLRALHAARYVRPARPYGYKATKYATAA
jgi:hypothetical protein